MCLIHSINIGERGGVHSYPINGSFDIHSTHIRITFDTHSCHLRFGLGWDEGYLIFREVGLVD